MASTSAPRPPLSSAASRIASAASNLSSDNQTLIAEIRKSLGIIKGIAVDLERAQRSDKVKELENTVLELLESYDGCTNLSEAINNVGNNYQPSAQPTDFRKLLEDEIATLKAESSFVPQKSPLYRQFKEAIWNVHHEGQPMPGEEQEDIVMTSTQNVLLNMTCPLTGKPIVELQNPVRWALDWGCWKLLIQCPQLGVRLFISSEGNPANLQQREKSRAKPRSTRETCEDLRFFVGAVDKAGIAILS